MNYLTLSDCRELVFPFIYEQLSEAEPTAAYEEIKEGMEQLEKVLTLVQHDSYYPTFADKCSYIFCSIVGSQYFPNGNKRLGVITLMAFLVKNNTQVRNLSVDEHQALLRDYFPKYVWEPNANIHGLQALFLYNLAIVIGDRTQWNKGEDFEKVKQHVKEIMKYLYSLDPSKASE